MPILSLKTGAPKQLRFVFKNFVSGLFYGLLFLFFLFVELLVLFVKFYEKKDDYEMLVDHQLFMRDHRLKDFQKMYNNDHTVGAALTEKQLKI